MMKSLKEKATAYRVPEKTTAEELGCNWETVINFGDKVILAGYYYNGPGKVILAGYLYQGKGQPSHFAAVYTYTKNEFKGKAMPTFHCDDEIKLIAISDEFFADNGHAIAWAINH